MFDGNLDDFFAGSNYSNLGKIRLVIAEPSATNKPTDFADTYCCVLQIFNMELCWSYWADNDKVFFRFKRMSNLINSAWREL